MIDRKEFMQEMQLRKHIRKAIKAVQRQRINKEKQQLREERQLRTVIQQLIKESGPRTSAKAIMRTLLNEADPAVAADAVHSSTGINSLEDLFKNTNLLSVLRKGYKSLTSKEEQRESYKNHILSAVGLSLEVEASRHDAPSEEEALQEIGIPKPEFKKDQERAQAKRCMERYYPKEAGLPVNAIPGEGVEGMRGGAASGMSLEDCNQLLQRYPEVMPGEMQKKMSPSAPVKPTIAEDVNIDIGRPEDNPAFIDVEKREPTADEEVEEFSLAGHDKTGRNKAYTDYKNVEKNIITAFDDLDDPEDRSMFKDYLLTNLKLYFERFEEELQTDLPAPDIETPEGAEEAHGDVGEELGLQEEINADMDEIVEWLLLNATK